MTAVLLRISSIFDGINEFMGKMVSWLTTILVLLIVYDVLMRYGLNQTSVWIAELEWHLFAAIFLLGAAYTYKHDQHVRVDVWYLKASDKTKAWINFLGCIIFLIPMCLIILKTGFVYAQKSFAIQEGSPDPGGLPARFIIKSTMFICALLLLIQALSTAIKSGIAIFSPNSTQ